MRAFRHFRIPVWLGALGLASGLTGCAGLHATPSPNAAPSYADTARATVATEFVGFWESWSDTNANDAFYKLGKVPRSVTTTDVAFSVADGNAISPPQNGYPIGPGAKKIHAHGGRVLLSFGGATSQFGITDPQQFVANLKAYMQANPGVYDGFDFDDEVIPTNGQQQLIGILRAVRAAFPTAIVSFDAFIDGADPGPRNDHQGEDIPILRKAGKAIDYVNVMAYDQDGWKPTTSPNCSYQQGSADDCRLDALHQFANVKIAHGKKFPKSKIVLGLMIGQDDFGVVVTPHDASGYGGNVKRLSYRGVMIWDLDLDNPQAPLQGTGHPKGTYVKAISSALGTSKHSIDPEPHAALPFAEVTERRVANLERR